MHIQLYARSEGPPLFNSRIASMLVLESLLVAMAPHLESQLYKRFEIFEELREEFSTFARWPQSSSKNNSHPKTEGGHRKDQSR
mgnify:CR=1 FL=1